MVVRPPRAPLLLLVALLGGAALLRLLAAWRLPNLLVPDEIFQSLEQAHRLAFGPALVPWEFRVGARSWLLPGLLAGVMRLGQPLAAGAAGYLGAVTVVLVALSLAPVLAAWRWAAVPGPGGGDRGPYAPLLAPLLAAALPAVWFEAVYFAPKALSEAVAAHLLVLGLALLLPAAARPAGRARVVGAGALLGLAAALRLPLLPAVLLAAATAALPLPRASRRALTAGLLAAIGLSGALDWLTWGVPFSSWIRNFTANLLDGRAASFGVAPWWEYFAIYGRVWGALALPLLALAAVGARRAPPLAVFAGVVLLSHLLVGHKEYRYLYPAALAVVVLAGLGGAVLLTRLQQRARPRLVRLALVVGLGGALVGSAQRALLFTPARSGELAGHLPPAARTLPHWLLFAGTTAGLAELAIEGQGCGVGLYGVSWVWTGGYASLHRPLPLFEVDSPEALVRLTPHFDRLFAPTDAPRLGPFAKERCDSHLCRYRRPGGCTVLPGHDLQRTLVRRGQ